MTLVMDAIAEPTTPYIGTNSTFRTKLIIAAAAITFTNTPCLCVMLINNPVEPEIELTNCPNTRYTIGVYDAMNILP